MVLFEVCSSPRGRDRHCLLLCLMSPSTTASAFGNGCCVFSLGTVYVSGVHGATVHPCRRWWYCWSHRRFCGQTYDLFRTSVQILDDLPLERWRFTTKEEDSVDTGSTTVSISFKIARFSRTIAFQEWNWLCGLRLVSWVVKTSPLGSSGDGTWCLSGIRWQRIAEDPFLFSLLC